jgi:transposase
VTQDVIAESIYVMSPRAKSARDFDELERRRMRAARSLDRGVRQAEVARQVKVSRESVRRWANQIAKQGVAGLEKAGRAGRRPQLSAADLEKLEVLLRAGPEKAGFPNGLWTLDRIAQLIRQHFHVNYHAGHVWWILRRNLGWSCQRPVGRARERNEAAIRDWRETTWPALKKKPSKKAASSSS